MESLWTFVSYTFRHIGFADILDIAFVTVLVYALIKLIRDTRAAQLMKGILLVVVFLQVAKLFELSATEYILNSCIEFGILAVIIVFQPELRSALEKLGRKSSLKSLAFLSNEEDSKEKVVSDMITELTEAVSHFAATKTGALVVIERETKLGEIINTGIPFDAEPKCELIMNIFFNKAPLHDGAMIIRDGRIAAGGCYLPLHEGKLDTELGTRHRAGLGISEVSDAIIIIVSEETGIISVALDGKLQRRLSPDALSNMLHNMLIHKEETKKDFLSGLWKGRKE